jgi:CBS domain-containing membrane protein
VVARYGQVLDVAPDELVNLLREAQGMATERLWRTLVCRDIMSPHPVFVDFKTSLSMAMQRMTQAQIKALPVVDQGGQVVGILTQADFLRLLSADASVEQDRSVGEFMTRQVRVASAHSHALDLLPLFSSGGHHHLPVIDQDKRLVGMLTQTDLVRALSRVLTRPGEHGAAQTSA